MKCEICGTKLNMYNKTKRCHAHTPGHLIMEAVPKNQCAAWNKKEFAEHNLGDPARHSVGRLFEPGNNSFSDYAYSFHEIGIVKDDGTLRRFDNEQEEEGTDVNQKST